MYILVDDELQDVILFSPFNNKNQLFQTNNDNNYKIISPVGTWSVEKNYTSPSKVNENNDRVKRKLFHEANDTQKSGN